MYTTATLAPDNAGFSAPPKRPGNATAWPLKTKQNPSKLARVSLRVRLPQMGPNPLPGNSGRDMLAPAGDPTEAPAPRASNVSATFPRDFGLVTKSCPAVTPNGPTVISRVSEVTNFQSVRCQDIVVLRFEVAGQGAASPEQSPWVMGADTKTKKPRGRFPDPAARTVERVRGPRREEPEAASHPPEPARPRTAAVGMAEWEPA